MKNKKSLLFIVIAFVLLMAGAAAGYSLLGETALQDIGIFDNKTEENKTPAADFKVYDVNGNEVKLSDMQGKPVVINIWASYCYACTKELPAFEAVYNEYKDDVVFMMIDRIDGVNETIKMAESFLVRKGYTFPVYYDTDKDAYSKLRVFGIPMTFFIDDEGNIVSYVSGELSKEELAERVAELLK